MPHPKKRWILAAALFFILSDPLLASKPALQKISLYQGEQQTLNRPGLLRVSIGDPSIAELQSLDDGEGVLVTALKPGKTDLVLWTDSGEEVLKLRVRAGKPEQLLDQVDEFLGQLPGLTVRSAGKAVYIEGYALRTADLERAREAARLSPRVKCLARLHPDILPLVAAAIRKELAAVGYPQLKTKIIGNRIYLRGSVGGAAAQKRALNIARGHDPDVVDMLNTGYQYAPQILTDVKIAEVNTSSGLDFGFRYDDAIEVDAGGTLSNTSRGSINVSPYTLLIKLLKTRGWGRMLANPKLVSRTGVSAKLLVGGEIPIRLVGERVAEVYFKQYGIVLEVTPTVGQGGVIGLALNSEISSIDHSRAVDGIPAMLRKTLNTSVNLQDGETLAIGGLIHNSAAKDVEKVPLLGHLPIIGELFKSRSFRQNRSQLLFFLTPTLIDPQHRANQLAIKQIEAAFERLGEKLKIRILD